ncbi:MAG TPA: HdeD family acid-resistance protein [Bryobacteraceae bacterium]|jgi:uncharacterized membrane protein HdeD (DUF308 family)|nr:HdeD family acid-resistance protein [Bryobacteraceae bacterium]
MDQPTCTSFLSYFDPFGEIGRHWKWLLTIGILLVILGLFAIGDAFAVTVASMVFFGWVLLIAGIAQAVQAFRHRRTGHMWLHVLNAVLWIVVGILLLLSPLAGALVLTLLMAAYFLVTGIFRIIAASVAPVQGWPWILLSGIVNVVLGILIWLHWPASALWVIGLFIGIDLLITGWSQIMLAFALRKLAPPASQSYYNTRRLCCWVAQLEDATLCLHHPTKPRGGIG